MAISERPATWRGARTRTGQPRPSLLGTAGLAGLAALAALAGALLVGLEPRDAPAARWCVLAAVACVLAAALGTGRGRHHRSSRQWLAGAHRAVSSWRSRDRAAVVGAGIWLALALAVTAWDLTSFLLGGPGLPTLSHLVGHLTDAGWGRAAVFSAWLAVGAWAGLGWRRR